MLSRIPDRLSRANAEVHNADTPPGAPRNAGVSRAPLSGASAAAALDALPDATAVEHEAVHDPLTGLANRTLFTQRLDHALTPRTGRSPRADIGVLYLDLDGFKTVNDAYGHDAGDELLMSAAHRLKEEVRAEDTPARLGGDEFAVLAPRINPKPS